MMSKLCVYPLATMIVALLTFTPLAHAAEPPVKTTEDSEKIVMDNGFVVLTLSKKSLEIASIVYEHDGQKTEMGKPGDAMYYDVNAGPKDLPPGATEAQRPKAGYQRLEGLINTTRLIHRGPESAEVVIQGGPVKWFPFRTEVHYVLPRGESGFYAYVVHSHESGMPAGGIGQSRFVLRGPGEGGFYTNHVIDAQRKGPFPTSPAVQTVSDATFLLKDGTVYCKYDNTAFMENHRFHGMAGNGLGIWMVTPSNEYANGGPVKQELTVHMGNTLLSMLQGGHYGAGSVDVAQNEKWSKIYGPFFVYANHGASIDDLYKDAEHRADIEAKRWPYEWVNNSDYPVARGTVTGTLHLTSGASTQNAMVVLAAPGGDWPEQSKNYQFWTRVGAEGRFYIPNVRPGTYTVYAYGANEFEQFHKDTVTVSASQATDLGTLEWKSVTHGKTLWQIGMPDRASMEFKDGDNVRHWANYMRYPQNFPNDVTYTVGRSRPETDWNYAQWTWYSKAPAWKIDFDVPQAQAGKATLTLGIAAANPVGGRATNLHVKVNGHEIDTVHVAKSGAAVYRSGGQDSEYRVVYVIFDAGLLRAGKNEITLAHQEAKPFPSHEEQMKGHVGAVVWDALRLEVENAK